MMDLEPKDPHAGSGLGVLPALADDHWHSVGREPQDEVTSGGSTWWLVMAWKHLESFISSGYANSLLLNMAHS